MSRVQPGSPSLRGQLPAGRPGAVRYRLEVRLSAADAGSRVVIRWRRPAGAGDEVADVLGVLTAADDASFTISNLGMYGIRQFTAVINPPQAAILAVGEAVRQPVVREDRVTITATMTLTLPIDHRAVDGATAAGFLARLKDLIEEPLGIVL